MTDPWLTEQLDLDAYLERLGVIARPPSIEALAELQEAHVRAFTFDNIDVLPEDHAGVGLPAVQDKFVGRGRGGYCFEHTTLFAAAAQRPFHKCTIWFDDRQAVEQEAAVEDANRADTQAYTQANPQAGAKAGGSANPGADRDAATAATSAAD